MTQILDYQTPTSGDRTVSEKQIRTATLALLCSTFFWGCGFTWAKSAGERVNALTAGQGAAIGPVWLLAVRFLFAGLLWLAIFPASRRGWTWKGVGRAATAGSILAVALIVQHLGLDRGSEAVIAFLTSLTILFVPLIMTLILGKPPAPVLWVGVALAVLGVWLMTGAATGTFGLGETLGLVCAVLFSLHLISVNAVLGGDSPARMTAGQFLAVGLFCGVFCLFVERGPHSFIPSNLFALATAPGVSLNLALMIVFVTIGAFGLQTHYQPYVDPTRAALLYLVEPIFAAIYPWLLHGRGLTPLATAGAAIILIANVLVEVIQSRRKRTPAEDAGSGAAIVD